MKGSVGILKGSVGILKGSVGILIGSVGILIGSVGILIGSVGILIHWYYEHWYFERWYFEPLPIPQVLEEGDIDDDKKLSINEFTHVINKAPDFLTTFNIRI